ncbi:MAG: rane protein-like protein, partial [Variovorax sp.]|nr:rane protein-like protein [Variovorax sp.]
MATIRGDASRRFVSTRWRQGLPLAIAVLAAWGVSLAVGLPESFWSVMSVLIVMRPSAGSTLGAGWERVRGTAVGAAVGLAGVYLQHHGAPALATTLALVALLGLIGGAFPGMRSAPVAALIILSAGGIPGHSALQVAVLRMMQIGIGVGVALLISVIAAEYRAGPRFREGCAALLQRVAMRVSALAGDSRPSEDAADGANAATRAAMTRLTVLADSADRESALW